MDFNKEIFFEKKNRYVLLIPLFNEGERYFAQVEKMKSNRLFNIVDVVICDAGSTDGTTNPTFLRESGHRGVLTRLGPGRYSTDIRMGYSWALSEGYDGIITVDGNDKDDTSAINLFIDKLNEGFDYIQGSRFIKGGREINTPFIRFWAMRLINEPVMSFCARKHLTDTTNGFRAYSRKFLIDKRLQLFRDIFWGYELIYYLPVKACRMGYKFCEVPVTRAYPKGEVPSKVGGVRGNIYQLSILYHMLRGHYDPDSSYKPRNMIKDGGKK